MPPSRPPCPTCLGPCTCPTAEEWARARGEKLPHEIDTGRIKGDRSLSYEQRRELHDDPEAMRRLGTYLESLRARLAALRLDEIARAEELRTLRWDLEVLEALEAGVGVKEFGRRHGKGHPWAVEQRQRALRRADPRLRLQERAVVAVLCACGCRQPIVRWLGTGRPPRYVSEQHRYRAAGRRRRARRTRRPSSGGDCSWAR